MKNLKFFVLAVFSIGLFAHAQSSSIEMTCRAKAKEVAADAYRSCVTDTKQSQIDQVRKDYQKKLADLKSHYDKELKKISNKPAKEAKSASGNAVASTTPAPQATKGIARSLPTRKEVKNSALPVQDVQDGLTAVAVPEGATEEEPSQSEPHMELVPSADSSARAGAAADGI